MNDDMNNERPRARERQPVRRLLPLGGVLAAALALAACSGAGTGPSSVPTIDIPTAIPSLGLEGSGATACVDSQTMAILNQLKAPGADVQSILATNKAELIAGLGTFDPPDAATTAWRDALVEAISSSDTAAIAAQIAVLANGGVTIPAC